MKDSSEPVDIYFYCFDGLFLFLMVKKCFFSVLFCEIHFLGFRWAVSF